MPQHENERLPGLDLLRSLAIILVFCWHYPRAEEGPWLSAVGHRGWMGVDLFFVLSGYLIGNQLLREKLSLREFYSRRAFRILPNYLVIVSLYFLVPAFRESGNLSPLWKFLTFTQNFNLDFGAFSHAWSLCVEEHFYLVLPILVIAMSRVASTGRTVTLILAILLFGFLARGYSWRHFLHGSENVRLYYKWIYYPTYNRLDGLLLGVVVALIRRYRSSAWSYLESRGKLVAVTGIVCLIGADQLFLRKYSLLATVVGFPLLSLGFTCFVTLALNPRSTWSRWRVPGARRLAILSFALYLIHKQMIHLTHEALGSMGVPKTGMPAFAASMLVSFLAAGALYALVERPFLRLRSIYFRGIPAQGLVPAVMSEG